MKIEKILVYIEPKNDFRSVAMFAITLARHYSAQIIAVSIIKHHSATVRSRTEDYAWQKLYEFEEDAFENEVKISLLLEEVDALSRNNITKKLANLTQTFQPDLLVLSNQVQLNISKFITNTTIPTVFVPQNHNILCQK
ncbi:MAG: hypothetical protein N2201_01875 [candidate division WOR-3 bacterium]|nr:hypothetical protein [candidate division WOR-3 bacterium]